MNTSSRDSGTTGATSGAPTPPTLLYVGPVATAHYSPIGYRPKAWVACIDGKALCDARGGERRFFSEGAALKVACAYRDFLIEAEAQA